MWSLYRKSTLMKVAEELGVGFERTFGRMKFLPQVYKLDTDWSKKVNQALEARQIRLHGPRTCDLIRILREDARRASNLSGYRGPHPNYPD